ncbi:uncharacterized protein LOC129593838 [Paramacrobiotus metropolitanus]|uniref:uncharacterized protein LOC129593838 n=1 Tax=Paramacrobiotus metropolitanus TaxID=2943436 RepID=UPI002445CD52|nr:uncharacterized protein LOC129593838 [Paramacrobiotus metropolitanus]
MNWIPKEQKTNKQPTEKQIVQDYFRRHRPRVLPAASPTSPIPSASAWEERPGSATERAVSRASDDRHRVLPDPFSPRSSRRSLSEDPETLSHALGRMNVKRLAETVKLPQKHISTDLVHLELIKRIFVYQPRPPTPPPALPPASPLFSRLDRSESGVPLEELDTVEYSDNDEEMHVKFNF